MLGELHSFVKGEALRLRSVGHDLGVYAHDQFIFLKQLFNIEEVIVTDDEIVIDKANSVGCADELVDSSVSLLRKTGASKHSLQVGNAADLRKVRLFNNGEDDLVRDTPL